MADFINLNTFEISRSVNTPDYIKNTDYAPIKIRKDLGFPVVLPKCDNKYWKRSGNKIIEMPQIEKAVVDAGELKAQQDEEREAQIQAKMRELAITELNKEL